jgi:hypothetical protein
MAHGGRRPGAGRPRVLAAWEREELAQDYRVRKQIWAELEFRRGVRPAILRELAATYDITERMVERCLEEHPQRRIA